LGILAVGLGIGAAVASTPGVAWADDFQISIDGMDLFSTTDNTATAYSGSGDFAIAYGDGATASAVGGTGDYALAVGSGADAGAGGSDAYNGIPGFTGDTGADDDTAIDIGNNTGGLVNTGSFAGNGDAAGGPADSGTNSGDTAIDIGNNSYVPDGNPYEDGSRAGAGDLLGGIGNGNDDTAIDIGPNSFAGVGSGNDDVGSVFDPSGTDGSTAIVGFSGDSDLGAVFGDGLHSSSAESGNFLYDIMSPFGDLPGSTSGLLAELLSLF
jgi:hypothetical protein